ncbi:hypothetical protein L1887_59784 [Cichorium endivia]|nr:hypothetical protein L1887_59784 [Cichorium endivia]
MFAVQPGRWWMAAYARPDVPHCVLDQQAGCESSGEAAQSAPSNRLLSPASLECEWECECECECGGFGRVQPRSVADWPALLLWTPCVDLPTALSPPPSPPPSCPSSPLPFKATCTRHSS